jgi:hypothetical protein
VRKARQAKKEENEKMKGYEVRRNKIPEVMRSFEKSKISLKL